MAYAKIFDISEYQEDYVDFEGAYANGYRGVILRASIGLRTDLKFSSNYERASKTPLAIGAYHAFTPWDSAIGQGQVFHDSINGRKLRLYRWWDVELPWSAITKQEHSNKLKLADDTLGNLSGAAGEGIYTSASKWFECVGEQGAWAKNKKLWVANYEVLFPYLPSDWDSYDIWQYEIGRVPWYRDSAYNIDLDYFNGDDSDFGTYVGWPPLPQPPPMEMPMFEGEFDVQQISQRTIAGDNMQEVIIPADEGWVVQYLGMTTNVTSKIDRARLEIEPSGKMAFIVNKSATIEPKTWYPHNAVYNLLSGSKIRMKYYCPVEGAYATLRYYARKIKLI